MRQLWEVADFVRSMRRQMRFAEISRAPLRLLRVELRDDTAECDWMSRPPDVWDGSLRRAVRDRNESLQALLDAIAIRNLVFDALPNINCAVLRAFRQPAREPPELMILGTVSREAPAVHRVSSLVMRAKLYGFCFCIEDRFLRPLQQVEDQSEEFIAQSVTLPGRGGIRNGSEQTTR
jgi:hypothetical protein